MTAKDRVLDRDDVAKSVERAIVRCMRVLTDVRQTEGYLYEDVRGSRFVSNAGDLLAAELEAWGFRADRGVPRSQADQGTAPEGSVPCPRDTYLH